MNPIFQGNNNTILAVAGGEGTTNTMAYTVINNDEPNVSFTRASSQFMSAPSTVYNINTGGGFTAVTRVRFTGTAGNSERVFDFGNALNTVDGNIVLNRQATTSTIQFFLCEGVNAYGVSGGSIVQNQWTNLVCRYTTSSDSLELFQDGVLVASGTTGTTINNRTLSTNFIGCSRWSVDDYSNVDIAGLFVYSSSLSTSEITTCNQILTGAVSPGNAPSGAIFSLVARSLGLADGVNVSSWGGFTQATSANQPVFWRRFNNWVGLGNSIFSEYPHDIAYARNRWVAIGNGSTNTLAYSDNGINWTGFGKTIFSTSGIGVIPMTNSENYVSFVRASSQFMTAPSTTYNINTNGGFTAIVRVRFTTNVLNPFERIFQFSNTGSNTNGIILLRGAGAILQLSVLDALDNSYNLSGGTIVQNRWTNVVARYIRSTNIMEIIQDDMSVAIGSVPIFSDRTLAYNVLARDIGTYYSNIDLAGMFFYDRNLTSAEITTCNQILTGILSPGDAPSGSKFSLVARTAGYSDSKQVSTWGNFSQAISANQPVYYNSFTFWLAGGEGTNSIAYSYDGSNWTGLGTSIFATCWENAWNARISKWVAVGNNFPTATRSLAYSLDGMNWAGRHTFDANTITGISSSANKWVGGVLAPNGLIYGIPFAATTVLEINPFNNTFTTFGSVSSDPSKWVGGVLAPNGLIYGIPFDSTTVLKIDPIAKTVTTFGSLAPTTQKWNGGVLGPDGLIYGIPSTSTTVLKIDPVAQTATEFETLPVATSKWNGGVLGPNGKIYGIPADSTTVLEIDPIAQTATEFGTLPPDTSKWNGGVLGPNGRIYGIPVNSTTVLEINPFTTPTPSVTTFGNLVGTGKWRNGVLGANGRIYGIPSGSTTILEIDPFAPTATTFGSLSADALKWSDGVYTSNGRIYTIPRSATTVLTFDTVSSSFEQGYGVGSAIPYTNQVSTTAFPPTMSSNTSPSGFLASASTTYSASLNPAWQAFDNNTSTFWSCADNSSGYTAYNTNTGVYLGNITTGVYNGSTTTAVKGEWLQILLPVAIILSQFVITPRNDGGLYNQRSPEDFIVIGSNDGLNWTLLFSIVGQVYSNVNPVTFNVSLNNTAFNRFRLIITRVGGGAVSTIRDSVQVAQWSLYPTPALLVAGGNVTNGNALAYSYDGCSWRGVTGTGIFSGYCFGVAWNGSLWVAVGFGTSNCIATSPDGISWTARGKPAGLNIGRRVNWTGTYWLVAGEPSANGNCLAISYDGINWTGITRQGLFTNRALSAGSNFSVAM